MNNSAASNSITAKRLSAPVYEKESTNCAKHDNKSLIDEHLNKQDSISSIHTNTNESASCHVETQNRTNANIAVDTLKWRQTKLIIT